MKTKIKELKKTNNSQKSKRMKKEINKEKKNSKNQIK